MAWWYGCIAAGFLLLSLRYLLLGGNRWLIALRIVIAAGFAALARLEVHGRLR